MTKKADRLIMTRDGHVGKQGEILVGKNVIDKIKEGKQHILYKGEFIPCMFCGQDWNGFREYIVLPKEQRVKHE